MPAYEIATGPDSIVVQLNGEVRVQDVAAFHAALLPALATGRPLVVDAAKLTLLDAAALQVLLAAARTAPQAGLVAPIDAWSASFRRHGLEDPYSAIPTPPSHA